MRKRWQVSEDQSTWEDVTPINGAKVTITESRDLDAGQIFFRKKLSTPLKFWKDDYTYFRNFERVEGRRCTPLYIRLQLQCGGWHTFWTGQFSAGSGKWDLTNCIFEVKPETVDRYTCLLKRLKDQKNVLVAQPYMTMVHSGPGLEFYACHYDPDGDDTPDPGACTNPTGTGWTYLDAFVIPDPGLSGGYAFAPTWVRKRAKTLCVGGSPSAPSGGGWTLLSNDCATDGTATYVKGLSSGERADILLWVWPDLIEGTCSGGVSTQPLPSDVPGTVTVWSFIELFDCTDPTYPSYWLPILAHRLDPDTIGPGASRTGRRLRDVADILVGDCSEVNTIVSDFFGIDAPGDTPGYVAGENYVTGEATTTEGIMICQKSDVALLGASNVATRGMMSLEDLLTALYAMFRVAWDIDASGIMRMEHISFWTSQDGIELSNMELPNEFKVYEYASAEIPRIERLQFMEARNEDFVGEDIVYDTTCASDEVEEVSPGKVTTDTGLILEDPSAISKDGFVLLSCSYSSGIFSTVTGLGVLSGEYVWNAPFSKANLQDAFWRHDRYLRTGQMNGVETTFDAIKDRVKQDDVRASLCCAFIGFDAKQSIGTLLGAQLGYRANVDEVTYDIGRDRVEFNLTYPY